MFDETNPDATFVSQAAAHTSSETQPLGNDVVRTVFRQHKNVPSWVASSERFVEHYKRRLVDLSGKPNVSNEVKEIRSALTRLQNTIAKAGST